VRVLLATGLFCLLATVVFAVGPAWSASRPDVAAEMKAGAPDTVLGGWRRRLFSRRNLLVMGQLGLSLMLLSTAGLFLRSALRAAQLAPGFTVEGNVLVELDPALAGYDAARGKTALQAMLAHFRGLPGVRSASLAATVPFGMVSLGRDLQRATDPRGDFGARPAGAISARYNIVADDYFTTLGIRVLRGREFSPVERAATAPTVAVVDRLAAQQLWPQGDALGQSLRLLARDEGRGKDELVTVVGVVDNVQESLFGEALQPHVYLPFGPAYQSDVHLHVRLTGGGEAAEARLLANVRREVAAVDDRLVVLTARSLRQHLTASFDVWMMRIAARMFSLFGVVAVLLAAIGLYGVRAFAVARRTREIGIRMAIGAGAGDALSLVLREGVALAAVGLGAGLVLSLALGRLLAGMLYHVGGADPLVLGVAAASLALVSLLACYLPARRAAGIAPMVSLRNE
jgi:predicted permease